MRDLISVGLLSFLALALLPSRFAHAGQCGEGGHSMFAAMKAIEKGDRKAYEKVAREMSLGNEADYQKLLKEFDVEMVPVRPPRELLPNSKRMDFYSKTDAGGSFENINWP